LFLEAEMGEGIKPAAIWRVEHWDHGTDVVRATAKGSLDLVLVTQKAIETLSQATTDSSQRFLIDDREANLALDTLEIYALPQTLARLGLRRDAMVAVVYTETSPTAADFQFFETVARNQGFRVKVFTAIEPAVQWLAH
jgi:hypothetical protein